MFLATSWMQVHFFTLTEPEQQVPDQTEGSFGSESRLFPVVFYWHFGILHTANATLDVSSALCFYRSAPNTSSWINLNSEQQTVQRHQHLFPIVQLQELRDRTTVVVTQQPWRTNCWWLLLDTWSCMFYTNHNYADFNTEKQPGGKFVQYFRF